MRGPMRVLRIPFSTNVERVALALAHKGIAVEWVEVDPADRSPALARFGPFEVVAPDRVALVGDVDSDTPGEFRRMLATWPGLRRLDIVECGGTVDDSANLALARMIRRAGRATAELL